MKKLIFVYGTLKKGCCNHSVLEPLISSGPIPVSSTKKYPMYKGSQYFPYLENQPGVGYLIDGELYTINEKDEHKLDHFEGVPDLYKKGTIMVKCTEGVLYEANCYFKSNETDTTNKNLITEWVEKKFNREEFLKSLKAGR